jgi:hypothetical protein
MTFAVGDGILTGALSQGNVTRLIKLGAAVGQYQTPDEKWHRYPPEARHFSHIALVISEDGTVAEAVKRGVRKAHVSKYNPLDCLHLRMGVEDERDRAQISAFAASVIDAHYAYGYVSFAACGANCLLSHFKHRPIAFGVAHTKMCSAFYADALVRAGVTWWKPEEVVMPADIVVQFADRLFAAEW